jgi:hypothetical protein
LEGDLKLRLLYEACASGLLASMNFDPFEIRDRIHLHLVLRRLRDRLYRQYTQRELMVSLVRQICMAIGNRESYETARNESLEFLHYLRNLDLPDDRKDTAKTANNDIIDLWVSVFGDPAEMERKVFSRLAQEGFGESEDARMVRERNAFVQSKFLRG